MGLVAVEGKNGPGRKRRFDMEPRGAQIMGRHGMSFNLCRLMSRFRSSPELAAYSEANFGIEGH
jgi:hypothetical protein